MHKITNRDNVRFVVLKNSKSFAVRPSTFVDHGGVYEFEYHTGRFNEYAKTSVRADYVASITEVMSGE